MAMRNIARIEQAALVSVTRALAFSTLAIMTTMVAVSFDPSLAMRMGAIMVAIVALVLVSQSWRVHRVDYRRTETYILLDGQTGLDERLSARIIRDTLVRLYRRFALYHGYAAVTMALLSVAL